ncbi:uncharacterized protein [Ptychodera flava]|uniref:uncharacterized protein n=1 Tax=Ptychodera flava TaxID=63121 RepID=UPI003969E37C
MITFSCLLIFVIIWNGVSTFPPPGLQFLFDESSDPGAGYLLSSLYENPDSYDSGHHSVIEDSSSFMTTEPVKVVCQCIPRCGPNDDQKECVTFGSCFHSYMGPYFFSGCNDELDTKYLCESQLFPDFTCCYTDMCNAGSVGSSYYDSSDDSSSYM